MSALHGILCVREGEWVWRSELLYGGMQTQNKTKQKDKVCGEKGVVGEKESDVRRVYVSKDRGSVWFVSDGVSGFSAHQYQQ